MEAAIQVVWWIGLLGALILTLVILKEVALVVRTLRGIHELAGRTAEAARGVARHVSVGSGLADVSEAAPALRNAAHSLAQAAGALNRGILQRTTHAPPEEG